MKQLSLRKGFAFAAALLLVGAAIAVAVATHGSGSSVARTSVTHIAKGDPDAQASLKYTPGEGPDVGRPAAEEWAHKAYPAKDIPFGAQLDALRSYQHLNATYRGSLPTLGPNDVGVNPWTSVGPTKAEYPDVLTFWGADYTAGGRTTALAIRQPCSAENCTTPSWSV